MIKACLSFLAGTYALHFTSFGATSSLIPAALLGTALLLRVGGRVAAILYVLGLAGFAFQAVSIIESRLQPDFEGDSMLTEIRIADFPRSRNGLVQFVGAPIDDHRIPSRIRLSWYQPPQTPGIGDVWRVELRLRRPRGTSNPGVFDYEQWLFRERIAATGYIVAGKRNVRLGRHTGDPVTRMRQAFVDRLESVVDDREAAAVIAAISVGARHRVSAGQWARYARSGTSHLMAISGLHVGLVATAAYLLSVVVSAALFPRHNALRASLPVSAAVAVGYCAVSGLAVTALRATLMILLAAIVLMRGRQPVPVLILATACMLVVVADPVATMAPGFKLSFGAVLLLLWLAKRRWPSVAGHWPRRLVNRGLQIAAMQLFLLFGLMPLTATIFQRISFVSPAVNFVAVPVFSLVTVPFALAGMLLDGPFAFLGDMALRVSAVSIQWLELLMRYLLAVPFSSVATASVHGMAWSCLVLVGSWVLLPPGWPGRHVAWLAAVVLATFRVPGPPDGCADLRMLDVGQGLAVVVRTRQATLLYDTGAAFRGGSSMAERVVLPYLAGQGVRRIDRLVVSHADLDHAGGARHVLAAIPVAEVLLGEMAGTLAARAAACRAGMAWTWNDVGFRVLHPAPGTRYRGNDASCVLAVETGSARVLLSGDIEASVERRLARQRNVGRSAVVLVPHHGSDTSSSPAFVAATAPALALVSAGHANRWGLPRANVVARWEDAGADVLTTAADGAIGVRLCESGGIVAIDRHRRHHRRIWHEPGVP